MRTRFLIPIVLGAALALGPSAWANPLDRDPSFGGDGSVPDWRGEGALDALETSGPRVYGAGGAFAGGSGEYNLVVTLRGHQGGLVRGQYGQLEMVSAPPAVADIVRWRHRVFAVGWLANGYDWASEVSIPDYGFVAAFRGSLRHHTHWGTERFSYWSDPNPGSPGLERLREVSLGSVTGGAVDSQGRVLVTGRMDGQTAVVRLTRDGHIDTSYGRGGVATVSVGSGSSPRDIAVHGTTAIVVGNATAGARKQGFATQITEYGYRDRSFAGDGIRMIGKPGSFVPEVQPADAGRWLIGYEHGKRAGVTKINPDGTLVNSFGSHGRASIRCTRPDNHVLDAITVDRKNGSLHRIAMATSCKRDGDLRRLASIWRPGGDPINALTPDATARLPYVRHTRDLTYGWRGRLTALTTSHIIRMR